MYLRNAIEKSLKIFLRRHKFEWQHYVRKTIDKNLKVHSYILLNISMFKQQQSKQSKNEYSILKDYFNILLHT